MSSTVVCSPADEATERDRYMSATEAVDFGLIDVVVGKPASDKSDGDKPTPPGRVGI